jgi:hypothetical protein
MKVQELLEARKKKNLPVKSSDDEADDEVVSDPETDNIPHIVMQLRKAIDVEGDHKIHFKDGTKAKLPVDIIRTFLLKYLELKPTDREHMQDMASSSLSGFKEALTTNFFTRKDKSIYAYK